MAGRNHLPSAALKVHQIPIDDTRSRHQNPISATTVAIANPETSRVSSNLPANILEDRITIQQRQIQAIFLDNQQLANNHVALKQEITLAQEELRRLSVAAVDVKAERDAQIREVYERSLKVDAELRSIDAQRAELGQVRVDIDKLTMIHQELTNELKTFHGELEKSKMEAERVPVIKAEIERMQREIQRGRAAIQYEKKTQVHNLEHGKTIEQNMRALAREIEKLHAALANAEKNKRASANRSPGYAGSYSNPEVASGGNSCPDPYAIQQVQGETSNGPACESG